MADNTVVLLVSGTTMLLSAGAWLWFGPSARGVAAKAGEEVGRLGEAAISAAAPSQPVPSVVYVSDILPDSADINSIFRVDPEEVLDSGHTIDGLLKWHGGNFQAAVDETVRAIEGTRAEIINSVRIVDECKRLLPIASNTVEELVKADASPGEIALASQEVSHLIKEIRGQQFMHEGVYAGLTDQLNHWFLLHKMNPAGAHCPAAEQFLGMDTPAVVVEPVVEPVVEAAVEAAVETGAGQAVFCGLTGFELALVAAFTVSLAFFATGLWHRYRDDGQEKPGDSDQDGGVDSP